MRHSGQSDKPPEYQNWIPEGRRTPVLRTAGAVKHIKYNKVKYNIKHNVESQHATVVTCRVASTNKQTQLSGAPRSAHLLAWMSWFRAPIAV